VSLGEALDRRHLALLLEQLADQKAVGGRGHLTIQDA
jgi:hypothetical protein